jgi:hypothetical protein
MTDDDDKADDQPATTAAESDATTIVPPPTEAAPELAWSLADDVDTTPVGRQSWGLAWGQAAVFLSIGAVLALVIAVVGWTIGRSHHDPQQLPPEAYPTAAAAAIPTTSATPAAVVVPPSTVTVQAAPPPTVTVQAPAPPPKTTIVTIQAAPSTVAPAPTVSPEPTVTRAAAPPPAKEFAPFEASDDQRLLNWLLAHGWTITNPRLVVSNAHTLCRLLQSGESTYSADAQLTRQTGMPSLDVMTLTSAVLLTYPDCA